MTAEALAERILNAAGSTMAVFTPQSRERIIEAAKIKPLVWEECAPSCFFGRGEFGDYSIAPSASAYHEGEIRISGLDGGFTYATSIEAAKAAAQSDYEARVYRAILGE